MTDDLTPEQLKAAETIEKLLRLAARNPNEAEATSAMNKAQALMVEYNLDQAAIEENSGDSGKRADEKLKGGHYEFQRDLWRSVAKLNFCLYFAVQAIERKRRWVAADPNNPVAGFKAAYDEKKVWQHRLVGRLVNVRSAKVMAEYLEQVIERLTREQIEERKAHPFGKWARSYREGMVERITEKITDRREQQLGEEAQKKEDAIRAAAKAGMGGATTGRSITLATFTESELEANKDFLDPNRHARMAAQEAANAEARARRARLQAAADAAYTRWAEANPTEAALAAAKRRKAEQDQMKRQRRNAERRENYYNTHGYRERTYRNEYKGDWAGRRAGYEAAEHVSIDRQADDRQKSRGALS